MANTNTANGATMLNEAGNLARDGMIELARNAVEGSKVCANRYVMAPTKDLFGVLADYVRDHPDVVVLWSFALGALVGWRLRR